MREQYRTICRALLYSLTTHSRQNYTMCNNKSSVHEFPRLPMIVSLYDSSISDTYNLIFASQSMIVTPYTKAKEIKEMKCFCIPVGSCL